MNIVVSYIFAVHDPPSKQNYTFPITQILYTFFFYFTSAGGNEHFTPTITLYKMYNNGDWCSIRVSHNIIKNPNHHFGSRYRRIILLPRYPVYIINKIPRAETPPLCINSNL